MATTKWKEPATSSKWLNTCRDSKHFLLVAVTVIIILDYILLTSVDNMTISQKTQNEELQRENMDVGIIFAAMPVLLMISNIFVGPLTDRIGYGIPMLIGCIILFTATIVMAFGDRFIILLAARCIQGIGSSFTSTAGMGALVKRFTDEQERGTAISITYTGICIGVLIGPPFGGVMYQFVGYSSSFLVLSVLMLFSAVLLFIALPPKIIVPEREISSLKNLITDPYIIIASGITAIGHISFGVLEPSLPLWMIVTMKASRWEQGCIFVSASTMYLVSALVVGRFGHLIGRWKIAFGGLVLMGVCLFSVSFARNMTLLVIPTAGIGLSVGMIENSMGPELAHLVDIRHTPVYGTVYAIGNFTVAFSYVLGAVISATLVTNIGFKYTTFGIAGLSLLVAPVLFFLRNVPSREETGLLLHREGTPETTRSSDTQRRS